MSTTDCSTDAWLPSDAASSDGGAVEGDPGDDGAVGRFFPGEAPGAAGADAACAAGAGAAGAGGFPWPAFAGPAGGVAEADGDAWPGVADGFP
ncbi:hypothetical protein [Myceligenerans indicum]|uniref:hypothetical protein n=1 Tax=Myceligenerans indicum TaxID=2593663 RepID=UPI001FD35A58|nr:hypothetical protein [Myceligenerans indicum]